MFGPGLAKLQPARLRHGESLPGSLGGCKAEPPPGRRQVGIAVGPGLFESNLKSVGPGKPQMRRAERTARLYTVRTVNKLK